MIKLEKAQFVFMFSGQGSQFNKMGLELYEKNETFRKWMKKLDYVFQQLTGKSVIKYLYQNDKSRGAVFDEIEFTHPAVFMVQYALAKTYIENGIHPSCVIGASLGEYVASCVAGVFTYEKALEALVKQVEILKEECVQGNMITILDDSRLYEQEDWMNQKSELISVNYDRHFVIAVKGENKDYIVEQLRKKKITFSILPVHYAFHSSDIDGMYEKYNTFLQNFACENPKITIYSSCTGTKVTKPDKEYLWNVLRRPMFFSKAIKELNNTGNYIYIDLGPSGTMENFVKMILEGKDVNQTKSVISLFPRELQQFEAVKLFCKERLGAEHMMKERKAYLFPGQGSQFVGMGGALFDKYPEITKKADEVLGYSIKELCLEDKDKLLGITKYTQPALYVVNILEYLKALEETGEKPEYVAGHSLGEYCALYAAGVFDFETGLRIVKKRAELMNQAVGGGMAAIVGLTEEEIRSIIEENHLDSIDIANLNSPKQVAISGPKKDIEDIKEIFEKKGARYIVLKVSGAFHSRYMKIAINEFKEHINRFTYKKPEIPVISNYTARPYKYKDVTFNMEMQMVSAVKWVETVRYIMGKGIENIQQIGPGNVITGLVRRIKKEAEPLFVEDEAEEIQENIMEIPAEQGVSVKEKPAAEEESIVKEEVKEEAAAPVEIENQIGSALFKKKYGLKYAYLAGSMDNGISTPKMVSELGNAGCMAFLGTRGLELNEIEDEIKTTRALLDSGKPFGVNVFYDFNRKGQEEKIIDLLLRLQVNVVEASSYLSVTSALAKYKITGLKQTDAGSIVSENRIIAKVSRPDIAEMFMEPVSQNLIQELLSAGEITEQQAVLAGKVSVADDLCVIGDQAGPTDQESLIASFPVIKKMKAELAKTYSFVENMTIGAAGGIGTPDTAAGIFLMGADFILTGSINLCTVESGMSEEGKQLLSKVNIQDMTYVPSLDMFEFGGKWHVLKKGIFFAARANILYDLYKNLDSLKQLTAKQKEKLEAKYFKKSIEAILAECEEKLSREELEQIRNNGKSEMAIVFKWYIENSMKAAMEGKAENKVDYCIKCSSAIGAFNQIVKGTELESWKSRKVAGIAEFMMNSAADILNK